MYVYLPAVYPCGQFILAKYLKFLVQVATHSPPPKFTGLCPVLSVNPALGLPKSLSRFFELFHAPPPSNSSDVCLLLDTGDVSPVFNLLGKVITAK